MVGSGVSVGAGPGVWVGAGKGVGEQEAVGAGIMMIFAVMGDGDAVTMSAGDGLVSFRSASEGPALRQPKRTSAATASSQVL